MAENATETTTDEQTGRRGLLDELPLDQLREGGQNLLAAFAQRGLSSVTDKVEGVTERLTDYAEKGGPGLTAALTGAQSLAQGRSPLQATLGAGMSGVKDKVQQALGGSGGGGDGGGQMKFTNIIEQIDVGVPVHVAYNQWTQFQNFPDFMKKVEQADEETDDEDEQKLNWRARVLWSPRSWEATVIEQVPDSHIVWNSTAQKGRVDGAVTFHELASNLTRILVVLEYHPQGFVEGTANLWRAAGRRARLEIKHFARHVMTQTILNPDDVEGWRGEIRDGEIVKTHEQAVAEEQQEASGGHEEPTEEYDEYEEEPERAEAREPADDGRAEDRESVSEAPAEYEDESEEEPEPEPATSSRRRR